MVWKYFISVLKKEQSRKQNLKHWFLISLLNYLSIIWYFYYIEYYVFIGFAVDGYVDLLLIKLWFIKLVAHFKSIFKVFWCFSLVFLAVGESWETNRLGADLFHRMQMGGKLHPNTRTHVRVRYRTSCKNPQSSSFVQALNVSLKNDIHYELSIMLWNHHIYISILLLWWGDIFLQNKIKIGWDHESVICNIILNMNKEIQSFHIIN